MPGLTDQTCHWRFPGLQHLRADAQPEHQQLERRGPRYITTRASSCCRCRRCAAQASPRNLCTPRRRCWQCRRRCCRPGRLRRRLSGTSQRFRRRRSGRPLARWTYRAWAPLGTARGAIASHVLSSTHPVAATASAANSAVCVTLVRENAVAGRPLMLCGRSAAFRRTSRRMIFLPKHLLAHARVVHEAEDR